MFGHLKINRAVATCYDQLAESFLSMVQIAAPPAPALIPPRSLRGEHDPGRLWLPALAAIRRDVHSGSIAALPTSDRGMIR